MRLRRWRRRRRKLGGGNSTGSADVKITIPKSTSSDINILGDFQITDTDNFYYEIYYSKPNGSSESEHKFAGAEKTVTFSNVKYDTYTFYLKIWVDNRMKQVLTTDSKTVAVSESESKVEFPDRSVSEYKNWFFVSNATDLTNALTRISSEGIYTSSNKAKLCLRNSISFAGSSDVKANPIIDLIMNGFELEESLFSVTITEAEGGTVMADRTQASAGRDVTVTVNPNENYKLKSLKMNGTALTVADGTATFSMPSENATITAEFYKIFKIKYTITVTGANAFPASSSFTLYDCSTDALSESFNKDTPVAVAEDEITTTSLMKPSYSGYIASVDSTDTPYIFKGWDYDGDGTADTTDTSTSAKLTDTIFAGKNAGDEVTLAAVWAEATTDADKESVWSIIPYNAIYYNNHSTFQIWTDAQAENIFVDLNSNTYDYSGKTIELMADVSVNKGLEYLWGTFNGNNKTLTVNITTSGFNGCAPFINVRNATIKDLTVAGTITAPANSYYVGGIAGTCQVGSTIQDCTVTAIIKGVLSSGDDFGVGGIAGKCFSTIKNCTFSGTVQGYQNVGVGGIVGCCNNGTVQNNTVTGTIKYEGDSDSPQFDISWADTAGYGAIIGRSTGSSTDNVSGNTVSATATVSRASGVSLIANIIGYTPF